MKQIVKTGKYAGYNIKNLPRKYLLRYEKWYLSCQGRDTEGSQLVIPLFKYEYRQIDKELTRRGIRRRTKW